MMNGECLCNSIRDGQDCEWYEPDPKLFGTTYVCTPVRPGEWVYIISTGKIKSVILKRYVSVVGVDSFYLSNVADFVPDGICRRIRFRDFGRIVFRTRAEAEEAQKRL